MQTILITGGTGFLGGALVRRLLDSETQSAHLTVIGRNQAVGRQLEAQGVRFIQADLADGAAVEAACAGQDYVFHCGARSSPWGRYADFYAANVLGTQHVIRGCQRHAIRRLIYVSTPGIYFNGQDRLNIREDAPLPAKQVNPYTETKRLAEEAINQAYRDGLPVITLRPRAIFGPGDAAIFPRLLQAIQSGRLRVIGDGQTVTDLTYVDNVVQAMLLAQQSPAETLGWAYNISNGEPINIWATIRQICDRLGYPPPTRRVPKQVAYAVASLLETGHRWFLPHREPLLTRYAVGLFSTSMTLDISRAHHELGYQPQVSVAEGLERVLPSFAGR